MGNSFWFSWEPDVIKFLQSHVTPLLQKFFEEMTFFGDEYAIILIIGFLYWGYKKDLGKKIGLYFISSLMTTVVLGNIVVRRRPYFDHKDIRCLKPRSNKGDPYDIAVQGFSFPSGHSANAASSARVQISSLRWGSLSAASEALSLKRSSFILRIRKKYLA